jgi:hypothetical protein
MTSNADTLSDNISPFKTVGVQKMKQVKSLNMKSRAMKKVISGKFMTEDSDS